LGFMGSREYKRILIRYQAPIQNTTPPDRARPVADREAWAERAQSWA
jgi:hypothetical protein